MEGFWVGLKKEGSALGYRTDVLGRVVNENLIMQPVALEEGKAPQGQVQCMLSIVWYSVSRDDDQTGILIPNIDQPSPAYHNPTEVVAIPEGYVRDVLDIDLDISMGLSDDEEEEEEELLATDQTGPITGPAEGTDHTERI